MGQYAGFVRAGAFACVLMSACATAQQPDAAAPAAAAAPTTCASAEHHQFDFWVGEWDVSPSRNLARVIAQSSIKSTAGGCVIDETWRPLQGDEGRSLSSFNTADGRWHQFYIDASGTHSNLMGTFIDGAMTLDNLATEDGRNRMLLRALDADTVRQWGERFDAEQNSWVTTFDLTYKRRAPAPATP